MVSKAMPFNAPIVRYKITSGRLEFSLCSMDGLAEPNKRVTSRARRVVCVAFVRNYLAGRAVGGVGAAAKSRCADAAALKSRVE